MKLKMIAGIMLTLLMASMGVVLAGKASSLPVIAHADSTATVYLDPPIINGTVIGQDFNVSIMIRDGSDIQGWQSGMIFNATLLECTGFFEGEFLKSVGSTFIILGTINNIVGEITAYSYTLLGETYASGDGRLAYATFKVKAPGVSDLHLRDVMLSSWIYVDTTPVKVKIPTNIIDVYTVVVDTTRHTVFTVSNSTGHKMVWNPQIGDWVTVHSGFYDHAFVLGYGISFNITGPYLGFSNVTIPKTLMWGPDAGWTVIVDGIPLSTEERTVTYDDTHYSIYFTYSNGTHTIQITSPNVVSEFPTTLILPLFMLFTLIAVALTKKITIKKKQQRRLEHA